MVILLNTIEAKPSKSKELEQTLFLVAEQVRREPGCVSVHCYRDVQHDHTLCLVEEWATQADADAHLHTEGWTILRGATALLGTTAQIQWCAVSRTLARGGKGGGS
jgi:quinol monooxygenase YgiN